MQVHATQGKWPQNDLKESRNDPWEGSEVREEAVEVGHDQTHHDIGDSDDVTFPHGSALLETATSYLASDQSARLDNGRQAIRGTTSSVTCRPTAPVTAPERLASHIGPSFDTVRRPNVSTTARGTIPAGHPPHRGPRSVRLPRRRAYFTPPRPSPVRIRVLRPGKRPLLRGQPRPGRSLESSGDGLVCGPGGVFVVGRAGI